MLVCDRSLIANLPSLLACSTSEEMLDEWPWSQPKFRRFTREQYFFEIYTKLERGAKLSDFFSADEKYFLCTMWLHDHTTLFVTLFHTLYGMYRKQHVGEHRKCTMRTYVCGEPILLRLLITGHGWVSIQGVLLCSKFIWFALKLLHAVFIYILVRHDLLCNVMPTMCSFVLLCTPATLLSC